MDKASKILIVGHNDVIERSLYNFLSADGCTVFSSFKMGMDASIQASVNAFFQQERPDYIFLGSTRCGGIEANIKQSGEFIYHNLLSQTNIVHAAYKFGAKKLLYYSSSCAYPKDAPQPLKPDSLFTGKLEPTSEAYATAKIAGIKLCQAYRRQYGFNAITAIPATVYGPESDTDLTTAHVMGALIAKFAEAEKNNDDKVVVWGSGNPRREFIYADDFVKASLFLMESFNHSDVVNIGVGEDVSIKDLASLIADVTGFKGKIEFDQSKPDGVRRKLLDNSHIKSLGWSNQVSLKEGIEKTYQWCRESCTR